MAGTDQQDAMITRIQGDVEERTAFIQGLIAGAQDGKRDLTESEMELIADAKTALRSSSKQLKTLDEMRGEMAEARERVVSVNRDLLAGRQQADTGPVEYRSAGAYLLDSYKSSLGDREAKERIASYETRAAAHLKTTDLTGAIPDPVVGNVLNFIDSARPIVSVLGVQPLPSATFHRPKVTQHTTVAVQGSAGAAADEKTELSSQKMIITRLNASAVTYGGYVNVSRQSIDLGAGILDLVINDLAAEYAIETEAAVADALMAVATTPVGVGASPTAATLAAGIWTAAGVAYAAVKGQGRLVLAVSPDMLGTFGPLFAPVNPASSQSTGFTASQFGQGVMGTIAGVSLIMSAGLGTGEAVLFSTAAAEAYETRVGSLQATEPSVLGLQVAYAGYFTPLVVQAGGVIPITKT